MELDFFVVSEHKDYLSVSMGVDFGSLWTGAVTEKYKKRKNWSGDFTGRPGLANDIFPAIKIVAVSRRPSAIAALLHELRSFWRYLDAFEKSLKDIIVISRIDSVSMIDTIHGLRWLRPIDNEWEAARPEKYRSVLAILQVSRRSAGVLPLYWPAARNPDRVNRDDSPTTKHGISLIRLLTRKAHEIWKRWDDADAMAMKGQSLIGMSKMELLARCVTEADIHATYREVIRITNEPAPVMSTFARFLGISKALPKWWPKKELGHVREGQAVNIENDLLPGLYSTGPDVYCLASLFMARSGWNPTTVFALDCSADEKWFRPYGEEMVWIHSYKERGSSWQDTVSPKKHLSHCFQIISRNLSRTSALREYLKADLSRSNLPDMAIRSPWLSVKDSTKIRALNDRNLPRIREYLANLITEYNSGVSGQELLPVFRPSDFRNVFAEVTHRGGNYSVFLTQIALGHKNSCTTRRYLRSLAWRKESELSLNALMVTVFDQIEVHQLIDFTLLRAIMDGVTITEEHLARLTSYRRNRTYSGLGCRTPNDPPEWIDPSHPHDGTALCIQGHRCASCPRGVVFKESLPQLAKCLAELEWRRENTGDVRWYESSDSVDMEVIEATLSQWPQKEVAEEVSKWRVKIANGEHHVLIAAAGVH